MAVRTCLLWLAPLGACVTYSPDHADVATVAAEAAQRQGGTFTLERAFTTALSDNPALLAAESRARAAGAMIQPLTLQSSRHFSGKRSSLIIF